MTPYSGMLEKARNDVRGATSPLRLLNIDGSWIVEFYESGALTPLTTSTRTSSCRRRSSTAATPLVERRQALAHP